MILLYHKIDKYLLYFDDFNRGYLMDYRLKVTYNFSALNPYPACSYIRQVYEYMYAHNRYDLISCTYQYCSNLHKLYLIVKWATINQPLSIRDWCEKFPQITSIYDHTMTGDLHLVYGTKYFSEQLQIHQHTHILKLYPLTFIQTNQYYRERIYTMVLEWLTSIPKITRIYSFGDVVHYAYLCQHKYTVLAYTDNPIQQQSLIQNCQNVTIVTSHIDLEDIHDHQSTSVLILSIIKHINLNLNNFRHLILVFCDEHECTKQLQLLTDYEIVHRVNLPVTPDIAKQHVIMYVRVFPKISNMVESAITYVSLSGVMGCAIAYQLNHHHLRTCAYPLDWLKIRNITSVVYILTHLTELLQDLQPLPINSKYPAIVDSESHICVTDSPSCGYINPKIGVEFRHEQSLAHILEIYPRRIARFQQLLNRDIHTTKLVFIRDELKIITRADLQALISVLPTNSQLHLICRNTQPEYTFVEYPKIKYFKWHTKGCPIGDWRRPHWRWQNIFTV